LRAISVTELNNQIKSILDSHFEVVLVKGEVSKVTYHTSGHLYFTLKDESSSINCAMWRSNLKKLKFELKSGDEVFVYGAVNLYVPRGEYKLIATDIEPVGVGALQIAFERLKEELLKLGYFDESKKKSIPKFPKRIAIITSETSAALQDMLRIAKKRWLLSKFYLFNVLVQGEGAAEDIARKIEIADNFKFDDNRGFDLIIVGRGGGSKEDLWAFNERVVADAIYKASTPIISAVGHEIDYLISDFVADKRAATPSNAMEIALPDKNEILMFLDEKFKELFNLMNNIFDRKEKELKFLKEKLIISSPLLKLENRLKEAKEMQSNLKSLTYRILLEKEKLVENQKRVLKAYSFENRFKVIENEINSLRNALFIKTKSILNKKEEELKSLKHIFQNLDLSKEKIDIFKDNKKVNLDDLEVGDLIELHSVNRIVEAEVKNIKE
jgi:exodeoxyribonuclease VII large subunit